MEANGLDRRISNQAVHNSSESNLNFGDYVRMCDLYVQNPEHITRKGDPWAKIAALYVLKHEDPETFRQLWSDEGIDCLRREIGDSADTRLINQYIDIASHQPTARKEISGRIPYSYFEDQLDDIMLIMAGCMFDNSAAQKLDRLGNEVWKYAEAIPPDKIDPRYIAIMSRLQSAADFSIAYSEAKEDPINLGAGTDIRARVAALRDLHNSNSRKLESVIDESPEIIICLGAEVYGTCNDSLIIMYESVAKAGEMLDKLEQKVFVLERQIEDCEFDEESYKAYCELVAAPKQAYELSRNEGIEERRKELNKRVNLEIRNFTRDYEAVTENPLNIIHISNIRAKVSALNVLKSQRSSKLEAAMKSRPDIFRGLEKEVYATEDWHMMKLYQNIVPYSARKEMDTATLYLPAVTETRDSVWKTCAAAASGIAATAFTFYSLDWGAQLEEPQTAVASVSSSQEALQPETNFLFIIDASNKAAEAFQQIPERVLKAAESAEGFAEGFASWTHSEVQEMAEQKHDSHFAELTLEPASGIHFEPAQPAVLDFGLSTESSSKDLTFELIVQPAFEAADESGIPEMHLELAAPEDFERCYGNLELRLN